MSRAPALVIGGGAAAAIATEALKPFGSVRKDIRSPDSEPRPTHYVTLNEAAVFLLQELFGPAAMQAIRRRCITIAERVIRWDGVEVLRVPSWGIVLSANDLAECLDDAGSPSDLPVDDAVPVFARGRCHNDGQPIGARVAFQWTGLPAPRSGVSTAYTVAVRGGWGMFTPTPKADGALQVIMPQSEISRGQEIALRILGVLVELGALHRADLATLSLAAAVPMQAAPRLSSALEIGSVAVGDELMSLDPLSGDGIGYCLRTAALFSAFASCYGLHNLKGNPSVANRIREAFVQHLTNCMRFYKRIHCREVWEDVIEATNDHRRQMAAALESDLQRMEACD